MYKTADAGMSAFSVFFTQSPSFLDWQRRMQQAEGTNNASSIFGVHKIPSDAQIRNLLDPVPPDTLFPVISNIGNMLFDQGYLDSYRSIGDTFLVAIDGTDFFSSNNISCPNCTQSKLKNGDILYRHIAVTPVIVAPKHEKVIPLPPQFVQPQDGHDKPDSHQTLYEWVEDLQRNGMVQTVTVNRRVGKKHYTDTYRFASHLPLINSDDATLDDWCELVSTDAKGKTIYCNAWATSHAINEANVAEIVAAARARWKIENENNNTLKTKGYHFEHNFGHGKQHLSNLLVTMILMAFLLHTALDWVDERYRTLRSLLPSRRTFFEHVRALMQ